MVKVEEEFEAFSTYPFEDYEDEQEENEVEVCFTSQEINFVLNNLHLFID